MTSAFFCRGKRDNLFIVSDKTLNYYVQCLAVDEVRISKTALFP